MNSQLKRPVRWVAQAASLCAALALLASCDALLQYAVTGAKGEPFGASNKSDGSLNNPIALTIDTAWSGKVSSERDSYYKITPTTTGTIRLAFYDGNSYYQTLSIAWNDEQDFSATRASSVTVSSLSTFTPSTSGSLDTCEVMIDVTANTPLYIKVSKSSGEMTYKVKAYVRNPDNEGSISSPVALTAGVVHDGKVGSSVGSEAASYYQFTPNETGYYNILMSNSSSYVRYDIYKESSASALEYSSSYNNAYVDTSSAETALWSGVSLTANVPTYLKLKSYSTTNKQVYKLVVRKFVYPAGYNTTSSPLVLTSTAQSSVIGSYTDPVLRYNYYKFSVNTPGTVSVVVSGMSSSADIDYYLYSNDTFTNSVTTQYTDTGFSYSLSIGTYYLKLMNFSPGITFSIKVTTP